LRDQLKRLEELQQFDAQIQDLDKALKAIQQKLEAHRPISTRVESPAGSERTQLTETQATTANKEPANREATVSAPAQAVAGQERQGNTSPPARIEQTAKRTDARGEVASVEAIQSKEKVWRNAPTSSRACRRGGLDREDGETPAARWPRCRRR